MKYRERLLPLSEEELKNFSSALIPNVDKDRILGIRIPLLRKLVSSLDEHEREELISCLPHYYIEEYQLHSFAVCKIKDYNRCIEELERLLPYVDNWAVCDSIRPTCFKKNRGRLLSDIDRWLGSEHSYTRRFALEMLMVHFLDEDFSPNILERAAAVRSGEYYINMMLAWFFATALSKKWEQALPYIEDRRLDAWVHNKAIQKATESFRISKEKKAHLRALKTTKQKKVN